MNRIYITLLLLFVLCEVAAQQKMVGTILDPAGKPIKGAYVYVVNDPGRNALSDEKGIVSLEVTAGEQIEVVYADAMKMRKLVTDNLNCRMDNLSGVVALGINSKTEHSLTQSVATVRSEELSRNATANPYNALYGVLPGLTVLQQGGSNPNSQLFIRGAATLGTKAPLIVVDGFVRPLEILSLPEIESITVLKDGAATAIWGSRGANGVVVVTTKRGTYKGMHTTVDYKFGLGLTTNMPEFADAPTYAAALNEALLADGLTPAYSEHEILAFKEGYLPNLYPNVDWLKQGLRDFTTNHQANFTFSGGGDKVRYFTMLDYKNSMGLLGNTDYDKRYNSQNRRNALSLRVNLDVDLTKTTRLELTMLGVLKEDKRPRVAETTIMERLYTTPSAAFPVFARSGLWGSNNIFKANPIADMASSGFFKSNQRTLQSDLRIKQSLATVLPGLSAEVAIAWDNMANYTETQSKTYSYEVNIPTMDPTTGEIIDVMSQSYGKEASTLGFAPELASQYMRSGFEARINYNRNLGKHTVDAIAMYRQEGFVPKGQNASRKYQSLQATASYAYNDRYFVDLAANYYGASVMSEGDRFRLYPAVSAAWLLSAEEFMKDSFIDMLKIRASWGRSGNADYGYELDTQYWRVNGNYNFGSANTKFDGVMEGTLPTRGLTCETASKSNFGVDMTIAKHLDFSVDAFYEKRSDILLSTSALNSGIIGVETAKSNDGAVKAYGMEASVIWSSRIGRVNYHVGGNFSFARNEIIENNEGPVAEASLSMKGQRLGQFRGLEAIGFFNSWEEINAEGAVQQKFSSVRPGDVKYKDRNKDGKIDQNDVVSMGYSTLMPEIYYGINVGFDYKGFGVSALFQGVANYSVMLNTANIYWPLRNNSNVSSWYLKDNVRWTEQTKEKANLPRLTTQDNANNFRNSSLWLRDASYFKLRNLDIYYNLPKRWISKLKLNNVKIYARGNNLFSIDNIDYQNCETVDLLYPDVMMIHLGLNIKF